ncbi:MAG TPA: hypothetical protein VJC13_01640 [Candidatus Paceibacterota bacterium]
MKTLRFVVVFLIAILISVSSTFAQSVPTAPTGTSQPGIISPVAMDIISIKPTGIQGRVQDYWGNPIPGASLVVSIVRPDGQSGQPFADHATAKKFGPCESGKTTDCVRKDGNYSIPNSSLPQSDNKYDAWRTIDLRGEAKGFVHHLANPVQISLDGTSNQQVQAVQMYESGFATSQAYAWRVNDRVTAVGFWMRQNWTETVSVNFTFRGSAWTAVQAEYGMTPVYAEVGQGPQGNGVWVERWFWTPQSPTAQFGGSFCGTIQISSAYEVEQVKADLKEVCVKLPNVAVTGGGGGGGKG